MHLSASWERAHLGRFVGGRDARAPARGVQIVGVVRNLACKSRLFPEFVGAYGRTPLPS